jgi:hypothetical protein
VELVGVRLMVVLWGGLAVVDVWRLTGAPSWAALGALAILTMLASVGMGTGTAIASAAVAWLVGDGFVVHRAGVLAWEGVPDLARFTLLLVVANLVSRFSR